MKTYQNTSSDTTLENILQTQARSPKTQYIFGAFTKTPTHTQHCPWDVSRVWDGPAAWWTARKGTSTRTAPALGWSWQGDWVSTLTNSSLVIKQLPAACWPWAAGLQQLGSEGRGALRGSRAGEQLLHHSPRSQLLNQSQTSAVYRHHPTQRRARWRTSGKKHFSTGKLPSSIYCFWFWLLDFTFRLEKFLTAHAVSSTGRAWNVFLSQTNRTHAVPRESGIECSRTGTQKDHCSVCHRLGWKPSICCSCITCTAQVFPPV